MHRTDELLSTTELAARLRVSGRTVQRLAASGKLPVTRVAGTPVYSASAVARALGIGPAALQGVLTPDELRIGAAKRWPRLTEICIGSQRRFVAATQHRPAEARPQL